MNVDRTFQDRAAGRRGVLASYEDVTHETRIIALERAYTDLSMELVRLKASNDEKAKAGLDIVKIRMSLPVVVTVLIGALTAAGAAWGSAAWVKSDIQGARSDVTALRGEFALETRLNDERNQAVTKAIDELRKRQELTEIEVRNQKRGR